MITVSAEASEITFHASVSGRIAVYLDNFALIRLAREDAQRRETFLRAIRAGGELLFSVSNAAELAGPLGGTLTHLRAFLDEVGAHWYPVELDPHLVVNREIAGAAPAESCLCERFLKDFFVARTRGVTPGSGQIIDLSERFFSLGAVLDWVCPQRDSIRRGLAELDDALRKQIAAHRQKHESDRAWLDKAFPSVPFQHERPARFVYLNLVRSLIVEAKGYSLKKGDGVDFCHAVIATAFASVATLDRHWKRRIENLPKPNNVAKIYYGRELDQLVSDLARQTTQSPNRQLS